MEARSSLWHEPFMSPEVLVSPFPPRPIVHFTRSKNNLKPFKPSSIAASSLLDD